MYVHIENMNAMLNFMLTLKRLKLCKRAYFDTGSVGRRTWGYWMKVET